MGDLNELSNDELFKLLKSSGINAGPITQSTRSVYMKKLTKFLEQEKSSDIPEKTTEAPYPVVILKANLDQAETEPEQTKKIFVKPETPKQINPTSQSVRAEPQQVRVEPKTIRNEPQQVRIEPTRIDTRRSVPRASTEEKENEINQPTETVLTSIRQSVYTKEVRRSSPVRSAKADSPKKVIQPEFKLLRPHVNDVITKDSTFNVTPNVRKRTATVVRPTVLENRPVITPESAASKKSGGGIFNFKYMLLVVLLTAIVYFAMTNMQANPQNPVIE